MLERDDVWLVEEPPIDDPSDPLTIPEIKRYVAHDLRDDELGLRMLLERPEALSKRMRFCPPLTRYTTNLAFEQVIITNYGGVPC